MADTGNLDQEPAVPESFSPLSVPMPAMLPSLVGHNGISRFFSLYYYGSKAVWDTGWESSTFPYYAGYAPLINHPVVGIYLLDKDLGSDDCIPTINFRNYSARLRKTGRRAKKFSVKRVHVEPRRDHRDT
jgi:hypothetical protein